MSRTRVVAGVQARMGSTRLPGKALADLGGQPMLVRVVERVRRACLVDEVVVLTSTEPEDDAIVELCRGRGIAVRRGPLQDVLARYLELLEALEPTQVVRVTGDCPLLEPEFIDLQLGALRAFDADLVDPVAAGPRPHPAGLEGTLAGAGAFSARALRAASRSEDPRDREHVGSFFFQREAERFRLVEVEVSADYDRPGLRLCVDEERDLAFVRRVFEHFGERDFSALDAIRWLDGRPKLRALHAGVRESADNRAAIRERLRRRRRVPVVGRFRQGAPFA